MSRETKFRAGIVIAIILLLLANFSYWLSTSIYNSENFQARALEIYKKPEVQNALSNEIVNRLLSENPGLERILSTPAQAAIGGVLGSPQLEPVFNRFSAGLQKYITSGQNEVSINLGPIKNIITGIARITGNEEKVPEFKNTEVVIIKENAFPRLERWLSSIANLGLLFGLIALITFAIIVYRSGNKAAVIRTIGIYLVVAVLINFFLLPFIWNFAGQNIDNTNASTIARSAYEVFTEPYKNQLINLLILGLLLTLAPFLNKEVKRRRTNQI